MYMGVGTLRLKAKTEDSTRLTYTGLGGGLRHLKIETRFKGERFEIVNHCMSEGVMKD